MKTLYKVIIILFVLMITMENNHIYDLKQNQDFPIEDIV